MSARGGQEEQWTDEDEAEQLEVRSELAKSDPAYQFWCWQTTMSAARSMLRRARGKVYPEADVGLAMMLRRKAHEHRKAARS